MAKLPGWLAVETTQVHKDHLVVVGRVRYWHPGFWLWLVRGVLRGAKSG